MREFMMSMMDEAEKQINYEENFRSGVKINYILPSFLLQYPLVGIAFKRISLLALFVVFHSPYLYPYFTIPNYQAL